MVTVHKVLKALFGFVFLQVDQCDVIFVVFLPSIAANEVAFIRVVKSFLGRLVGLCSFQVFVDVTFFDGLDSLNMGK